MIVSSRSKTSLFLLAVTLGALLLVPSGASAIPAGKIEGEVIDFVSKVGIEHVEVCAFEPPEFEKCEETGPGGEYTLSGLPDGSYVVEFWATQLGYVPQYFNGKALFEDANEVVITGGAVSGIDAELKKGGSIEGRVTDAATNVGIDEAFVCASSQVAVGGCALTDGAGDYTIKGLATASYAVEFWAEPLGYETRYYNEASSAGDAIPVAVTAPSATTGINARLSKPGSHAAVPHEPTPVLPAPALPVAKPRPKPHCKKGFRRVKRHGHKTCVKIKKKKHRKRRAAS
jgi:hypothetical protein